ncbi:MAG: hypothetical protein ACPGJV_12250 [Bacteriovoracaceae bacterium]
MEEISKAHPLVIYHRLKNRKKKIEETEVVSYQKDTYVELKEVPENGGVFLWFPYVPHIFVQGIVETKDYERLELKL